jgi:hydrogenase nickel incorporation protein HypA/HybF
MHEITIAQNLADLITGSVPENDLRNISKVKVKIGILSNILPDSLIFCFNSIKESTPFSSAFLEIVEAPLKIKCRNCEKITEDFEIMFSCGKCGSHDIDVTGGDELELSEIILSTSGGIP